MLMQKTTFLSIILLFVLFAGQSLAAGLEKIQFLKISPQDHKAVMKTAEGELKLVGVGDIIAGAQVSEIVAERVVLRQGEETIIFRLDGKHQRIERISKRSEKAPAMVVPSIK